MGIGQAVRQGITAIAIASVYSPFAFSAHALPANPERPLASQTCDVAQMRLAEAQTGSPLISADEQAQVLRVARADVVRLCGADQIDGLPPGGVSPTPDPAPPDLPSKA